MNTNTNTAEYVPSRDGLCVDCPGQCETCGDCAYVETQGDWTVVGRFCGPDECRDAEPVDDGDPYLSAPVFRHQDGLVSFG